MAIKRISVDDLEIGMYVARLDRPWRETQFVFQGFEITDKSVIEEVKTQTRHVYILTGDEEIKVFSRGDTAEFKLDDSVLGDPEADKPTTPIEQELPVAAQSYRDTAEMVTEIDKALKSNEPLDYPRIRSTIKDMVRSIERNPDAYIWLARTKKHGSNGFRQALRVSVWGTTLARQMDLDEDVMGDIALGMLLMDVGFARVPREILQKISRLSNAEWETVKTHVRHSTDMLANTPSIPQTVKQLIATHHERIDGSGYPRGLRGSSIPLPGQIAGIVDYFAAVTRPRPFKKPLAPSAAMQFLYKQRNDCFSEALVDGFIHALGTYPTGSLVELNTGEVGIVSSQNQGRRLRPRIILLLNADQKPYGSYPRKNLLENLTTDQEQTAYIVRTLPDGEHGIDVDNLNF